MAIEMSARNELIYELRRSVFTLYKNDEDTTEKK